MKEWTVRYRVTYEGIAAVEAKSPEEALSMVNGGDFEDQPGHERVDWEAIGSAREENAMSETKHTAGPWQVLDGSGGMVYTVGSPYGHGQMHVADARGWGHLTGRGACALSMEAGAAIHEANAHLIAAAPELFEAVRMLIGDLEHREPDGWMSGNVHTKSYDAALAAISKALGSSPSENPEEAR